MSRDLTRDDQDELHHNSLLDCASAARVLSLRPVSFRCKPQFAQDEDQLEYGLIAEQVARLYP